MAASHTESKNYRADVDGLRAIAVLSVLIYHIHESLIPGGFAGVDVFFVISGFLITGNIIRGIEDNKFSFAEFYRRRFLRILPPLMLVIIFTLIAAQFLFLPDDLQNLSEAALASALSVANIYYYLFMDTSYFAADANVYPLLHIWSLGVEEQFYIIWPILLLFLVPLKRFGLIATTLLIAIASFVFAEMVVRSDPMLAYYMLPARAGQLMSGSLVFMACYYFTINLPAFIRIALSLIGLILVVASLALISKNVAFPGVSAVPVTLGTALIIFSGSLGTNIVNRLIGNKISVWIGLLSYSLYLWHWPIFAFYKYFYREFTVVSAFLATALVLVLTWLTYRFVEQPVRNWKGKLPAVTLSTFVLPTAVVASFLAFVSATGGFGFHKFGGYPSDFYEFEATFAGTHTSSYVCRRQILEPEILSDHRCFINTVEEPQILLWGDSHSSHYVGLLGALAQHYDFAFRNIAHSSCPPLLEDAHLFAVPRGNNDCQVSASLVASIVDNYDVIVLGAQWASVLRRNNLASEQAVESTVLALRDMGKQVVILGVTPEIARADPECQLKTLKFPLLDCSTAASFPDVGDAFYNVFLAELADRIEGVTFFNPRPYICDGIECSPYLGDQYAYFDTTHLNMDGSWELGRLVIDNEGLPAAFASLPNFPGQTLSTEDLRGYLEGRFAPKLDGLLADGIEIFNNPEAGGRWSRRPEVVSSDTFRFVDDRTDSFSFHRFRFDDLAGSSIPTIGDLTVRLEIDQLEEGVPLIRIEDRGEDNRLVFDAMLDPSRLHVQTKGRLAAQSVTFESSAGSDGAYEVVITAYGVNPANDVSLVISANSSIIEDYAYTEEATGRLDVRSISYHFDPTG